MITLPGPESPSVRKEDGDIMVSRTIRTPSGSMLITGTLTEVDRIYRLTLRSLLQNGYSSRHLTKTVTVPPGEPVVIDEVAELKRQIDRLVDQSVEIMNERTEALDNLSDAYVEVGQLKAKVKVLEEMLNNVTSRSD